MYYEENPKFVTEFLLGYLDDVIIDGDKYWMHMQREDLSKFFADDRDRFHSISQVNFTG